MESPAHPSPTTRIGPSRGWRLVNLRECLDYRDLFGFLVRRDITVHYKQTILGYLWAIFNPLFSMLVFTVIFGLILKMPSDGVPYPLFSFTALLPWTYFSQSLSASTSSLISGANLFTKVYFPRIFIPLVPVVSKLMNFGIGFAFLILLLLWYRITPSLQILFLPLLVMIMMLTSAGLGLLLSALAIQYRDVQHGMQFAIQVLMYAAPIVWPVSKLPDAARLWYGLYPMAGVIEGFRSVLLGTRPMPWDLVAMGSITAVACFVIGVMYFRRSEKRFADVA